LDRTAVILDHIFPFQILGLRRWDFRVNIDTTQSGATYFVFAWRMDVFACQTKSAFGEELARLCWMQEFTLILHFAKRKKFAFFNLLFRTICIYYARLYILLVPLIIFRVDWRTG
jgi:hypothetical protein